MVAVLRDTTLVRSPWSATFRELLYEVEESLLLVSPFIKRSKVAQVLRALEDRGIERSVRVDVLTDLRPESTLNGSTDLEAILDLGHRLPNFRLTYLPSLHAKVYLADQKAAIVTSGNLTESGISGNIEYGVLFRGGRVVREIRNDFEAYALLGAKVSTEEVAGLLDAMGELKVLFRRAEQTVRAQARRAFRDRLEATHVQLLRHRARGTTINRILSDTIVFLLAKGPLKTTELHPLIQRIHPDICDDSVDRIIDGVHFGKKWKHHVRGAQVCLRREGRIRYVGDRWEFAQ
jgi:phosphatidylserine/phosphatidylglycerophosphate/cardiolipin synthase-like enzyme